MKTYLVGGAVRDKLLNLPVKDQDWVVVGATPKTMLQLGYLPVGKDFPVFLHPETKEEFALARTERKSGHGYAGFEFHTSEDVTLEEDLIRRDLTINAMAEDNEGNIIDPFHGLKDLENRKLRHVSEAFQEDPLRILRVARFAARYHHLKFTIASETTALMQHMVDSGEASHLVPERVWQETLRALNEPSPEIYFQTLQQCKALGAVMPELATFLESNDNLTILKTAAREQASGLIRFGCLFISATAGMEQSLASLIKRMRLPAAFSEIARLSYQWAQTIPDILQSYNADRFLTLFEQTDAFRRPERFASLLEVSRLNHIDQISQKAVKDSLHILDTCRRIDARPIIEKGFKGKEVGEQLKLSRLEKLTEFMRRSSN